MSSPTGGDTGAAGHNPAARPAVDRDRILLDLGGEIRAMRTDLATTTGTVDGLLRDMAEMWGPDLVTLQTMVGTLRGEVDALIAAGEEEEEEGPGLHWPDLTTPEARQAWSDLAAWVDDILGHWFQITRGQLPDCWALHRPALLQLWSLRLVYVDAHQGRGASAVKMIEWDTRWLDATLAKISEAIPAGMCRPLSGRPGQHLVPQQEAAGGSAARPPAPTAPPAAPPAPHAPAPVRWPAAPNAAQVAAQSFARPAQPARNPYSIPEYAAAGNPPEEEHHPEPEPTAPVSSWRGVSVDQEPIDVRWWGPFFTAAREQDLAWRRERDARQDASDSDA